MPKHRRGTSTPREAVVRVSYVGFYPLGLETLRDYLDFKEMAVKGFPLPGLPISYPIDRNGLVVGYIIGAVERDSREAVCLLNYYIQYEDPNAGG